MYNTILNYLYKNFKIKKCINECTKDEYITFQNENGKIVGCLFLKDKVLNLIIKDDNVLFNHYNTDLLVIAKDYNIVKNKKVNKTSAAWLYGLRGARRFATLKFNNMYLQDVIFFEGNDVEPFGYAYKNGESVGISLPMYNITFDYQDSKNPDGRYKKSSIEFLNPALIYPTKKTFKKNRKECVDTLQQLRRKYFLDYINYPNTADFVENKSLKKNNIGFSNISFSRK